MSEDQRDGARRSSFACAMDAVDRALGKLENAALAVACAAIFLIMVLVFVDAILRYAFNAPLKVTMDLTTLYLLSAGMFLGLGYTLRRAGHICVDMFALMLPRRLYQGLIGIGLLCANVILVVMVYRITVLSWTSWVNNESTIGIYAWPAWLSKAIVAFALFVLVLRTLHVGLANLAASVTGNSAIAIPITPEPNAPAEDSI